MQLSKNLCVEKFGVGKFVSENLLSEKPRIPCTPHRVNFFYRLKKKERRVCHLGMSSRSIVDILIIIIRCFNKN